MTKIRILETAMTLGLMMLAIPAWASEVGQKNLTCGSDFERFETSLVFSSSGSGSFSPRPGYLLDGYISTTNMECAGSSLNELSCIGHVANASALIVEVTFVQQNGEYFAVAKTLKGGRLMARHLGPWPCLIH